jgi:hypothetical protein
VGDAIISPVIRVVEAGHVAVTPTKKEKGKEVRTGPDRCGECGVEWPCPSILEARKLAALMFPPGEAPRPREVVTRGRRSGKTREQREVLARAIGRGEHVHHCSAEGTLCWGGDSRCSTYREQGRKDAELP